VTPISPPARDHPRYPEHSPDISCKTMLPNSITQTRTPRTTNNNHQETAMSASLNATKAGKIRKLVIGGAAAVAVALPLAMASAPAHAATSLGGCTVDPLAPVRTGTNPAGVPIVRFSTRVTCVQDRIVQIVDQRLEADAPAGIAGDDNYGSTTYLRTFATAGTIVVSTTDLVTNTEASNEEAYHGTSFRVASIAGVTGTTAFEASPVLSVAI
jgi:hypothetical protein